MKTKKMLLAALPLAALILELLPNGVEMHFLSPEGEPWRYTYSYFDMTPFGYANVGPFITAVLTCVLLVLAVIRIFKPSKGLNIAIMAVSGIAAAASIMPIMYETDCITVIGIAITAILAGTLGCCFIREKN